MKKKTGEKESEFIDLIFRNIDRLVKEIGLPEVKKVYKEKELVKGLFDIEGRVPLLYKKGTTIPRVDILIQHKNDKKITIIEVKLYKSVTDLTTGLGQLLFYQEYIKRVSRATKIKGILIADKIPVDDVLAQVAKKNNLEIEFVEWNDNEIRILEPIDLGGAPELWDSPDALQKAVDNYFANTEKPTLAGLAGSLGMSRETLYTYGDKGKFSDIIKKSRNKVEVGYEERLVYGNLPTGVIFALKNMGWKDKIETDVTSGGKPIPILGANVYQNTGDKETPEPQKEN